MSGIVTPELAAQGIIAEHLADIVVPQSGGNDISGSSESFADTLQNANITAICTSLIQDKR